MSAVFARDVLPGDLLTQSGTIWLVLAVELVNDCARFVALRSCRFVPISVVKFGFRLHELLSEESHGTIKLHRTVVR